MSRRGGRTQSVYYRDKNGREPVDDYLDVLLRTQPRAVAKIDGWVEQYLNGHAPNDPPPEYPVTSQIEGELRELRVRFGRTRYRVLYRRSANLVVLLHIIEKNTGAIPAADVRVAKKRFADFKVEMDSRRPRRRPRAGGRDAPRRRRRTA